MRWEECAIRRDLKARDGQEPNRVRDSRKDLF